MITGDHNKFFAVILVDNEALPNHGDNAIMSNSTTASVETPFLSVEEAAQLMRSTPQSLYLYLCKTGARGGEKRKRFPRYLYTRIGRKVLFIRQQLMDWILNGAQFEGGNR